MPPSSKIFIFLTMQRMHIFWKGKRGEKNSSWATTINLQGMVLYTYTSPQAALHGYQQGMVFAIHINQVFLFLLLLVAVVVVCVCTWRYVVCVCTWRMTGVLKQDPKVIEFRTRQHSSLFSSFLPPHDRHSVANVLDGNICPNK